LIRRYIIGSVQGLVLGLLVFEGMYFFWLSRVPPSKQDWSRFLVLLLMTTVVGAALFAVFAEVILRRVPHGRQEELLKYFSRIALAGAVLLTIQVFMYVLVNNG
jgi:hypothetical protein